METFPRYWLFVGGPTYWWIPLTEGQLRENFMFLSS